MRIELPDDGWAVLYLPKKVRERSRRKYIAAMADMVAATSSLPQKMTVQDDGKTVQEPDPAFFGSEQMALADAVSDALVLCLVKEWSLGPVDADTLADQDAETSDALVKACRDIAEQLMPDYSPDPDPKAQPNGQLSSPQASSTGEAPTSETPPSVVTS